MFSPRISIVIASYNKATLIGQTIDSVLEQTYSNWQLVIIDDASTDGTASVLDGFEADQRVKVEQLPHNRGANFCRNRGIQLAEGDYTLFLDADDLLAPTCLAGRVEALHQHPQADLLVFSMGVFRHKLGDSSFIWRPVSRRPLLDFLQHRLPWTIVQPLWRTQALRQLGGFDLTFKRLQDVELHTRALLQPKFRHVLVGGEPDCFYRIDEGRLNFDTAGFLARWVDAARLYCRKYDNLAERRYLGGTLYQTALQLFYHRRKKHIDGGQFASIERSLLAGLPSHFLTIYRLARAYNLFFPRVPGINRLFHLLFVRLY